MQCGPQGRCTRCLEGWLLQPDGACARCLGGPNCVACAPLTLACTECTFMMGLNASGGCVECADQLCFNCTANSRCARWIRWCKGWEVSALGPPGPAAPSPAPSHAASLHSSTADARSALWAPT